MDALKPCPFCGSETPVTHLRNEKNYRIYCPTCRVSTRGHASQADAITAWNTRVPPPSAPVEAVAFDAPCYECGSTDIYGPICAKCNPNLLDPHPTPPAVERLELDPDIARGLPGGQVDLATYQAIEEALDKADAPVTVNGKFLTLAERVTAQASAVERLVEAAKELETAFGQWAGMTGRQEQAIIGVREALATFQEVGR